jgi:hypothetical protein
MRLVDLAPRWYSHDDHGRVGFTFECPCCLTDTARATRLGVAVHDAGRRIVSDAEPDAHPPGHVWEIVGGTDFGDITLTPSIDASNSGHWHGFITAGEIR